ncbi:vitelline membrane outer layer protein 1-like [Rana temporaria]|uniref:vitelline membrane outer layer protein 1-like n=1 Tax=Rana temporaria TaxID=8407 RepID=UPI001AAD44A1|nr:vitelline membrane outer layer protein 1-like [Rana temporaria]
MSSSTALFILLSLLPIALGEHPTIGVPNGGPWGEWGPVEWCPCGFRARGFSLKVEEKKNIEDDTALNGVRLLCVNRNDTSLDGSNVYPIQSAEARWGEWTEVLWCPEGFIIRFTMQVEAHKKGGDDTAANNFMFLCSDTIVHMGLGMNWGQYGKWSRRCHHGICGMKTKVESPQGTGDDTALNDVQFICCKEGGR